MNRIEIRDITDARTELNSACSLLEDVLGDYQEIAVAMDKINAVIDFLYENGKIEKIRKEANDIIETRGCRNAYELATDILYQLSAYKGYCIWQAYTVENVEANIGRKPTHSEMQELADNLQCFENIRTV